MLWSFILTTDSLQVMIYSIFCYGLTASVRINVGFVYFQELLPRKSLPLFTFSWFQVDASVFLVGTLYLWFVSKHWIYFCLVGYALLIVSCATMW